MNLRLSIGNHFNGISNIAQCANRLCTAGAKKLNLKKFIGGISVEKENELRSQKKELTIMNE